MEELMQNSKNNITLLLNSNIINKSDPQNRGWNVKTIQVEKLIQHIQSGYAFSFGVTKEFFPDKKPKTEFISYAQGFAIDIDNVITTKDNTKRKKTESEGYLSFESCLNDPWLQKHAVFMYTTASHNEDFHRFRIVFLFDIHIQEANVYKKVVTSFIERFDSDVSCNSIERIWYGSRNCKCYTFNPTNRISRSTISETKQLIYNEDKSNIELEYKEVSPEIVREILTYIPKQMLYMDWLRIVSAIGNYFGIETAYKLIEEWSPDKVVGTRQKLNHRLKQIGIGSLFHFAKIYGYKLSQCHNQTQAKLITKQKDISEADIEAKYDLNDTGNADRLLKLYGDQITYDCQNGCWLIWNSMIWEKDMANKVIQLMINTVSQISKEIESTENAILKQSLKKHQRMSGNAAKLVNAVKIAESNDKVVKFTEQYNTKENIISLQNGYYNLDTHQLEDFNPSYLISKQMNVSYDPNAKAPNFEKFLQDIFLGREDLIKFVMKLIGLSLDGKMDIQKVMFCIGKGNNGKSAFLEVISEMMGTYAQKLNTEAIFQGNKNTNLSETQKARLPGMRFITFGEIPENRRLDESLLKDLSGGEEINGRKLFNEDVNFRPQASYWLSGNHFPIIQGTDEGIWRRILVIPFDYQVPENKKKNFSDLLNQFRPEFPGILNLALEAYKSYQKDGLEIPEYVKDVLYKYRFSSDLCRDFLEECCEMEHDKKIEANTLYKEYIQYINEAGNLPLSRQKFYNRLRNDFGIEKVIGTGKRNYLHGIDLLQI